jgi:threonylcarbamoyladenosine tRNA methylthiotransferase MtaB
MYRALVDRLAAARPRLGLGADLIAGFPGETDEDFAETAAFVRDLPFSYLHVFPYSARAGTEAAGFGGRVDARVATRRSALLRDIGRAKSDAFRRGLIGHLEDVLVLETADRVTGGLVGLTGNFVEAVFAGPSELMRTLVRVRVTGVRDERTLGELDAVGASA